MMTVMQEYGIESMKVVESDGVQDLEIRYREGAEPLEWTRGVQGWALREVGLDPKIWRLGAGLLLRASDGALVEVVELRRAGGEE